MNSPYLRSIQSPASRASRARWGESLAKYLVPSAKNVCRRSQEVIVQILPNYFCDFGSSVSVRNLLQANDEIELVKRFHDFIGQPNSASRQDPSRQPLHGVLATLINQDLGKRRDHNLEKQTASHAATLTRKGLSMMRCPLRAPLSWSISQQGFVTAKNGNKENPQTKTKISCSPV